MENFKPAFIERIRNLLKNENDLQKFLETAKTTPRKSIRANTLKIKPEELKKRLEKKYSLKITSIKNHPELMIIETETPPGFLGKTIEHLLGYYYVQEITSAMPILALNPSEKDLVLDLCAAPGSKTTQAAAMMKNSGTIIANDISFKRIKILNSNLERCGVTNTIVTRHDGINLCKKLKKLNIQFTKILIDAPCSGEGKLRTSKRTLIEWSEKLVLSLSKKQKKLASAGVELLKEGGELVYSTCTYSPEENEEVIHYLLENHPLKIIPIKLPLKTRPGITSWKSKNLNPQIKKAVRIYHHDTDSQGFFICKLKKLS